MVSVRRARGNTRRTTRHLKRQERRTETPIVAGSWSNRLRYVSVRLTMADAALNRPGRALTKRTSRVSRARPGRDRAALRHRLLLHAAHRVARDEQLLVGGNHPHTHLAARPGDVAFRPVHRASVLLGIERDAEEDQIGADALADRGRVLADAAGEDDGFGAVQTRQVGADVLAHAQAEEIDGQARAPVAVDALLLE